MCTSLDLASAEWRKSSYSTLSSDCVEVADHLLPASVPVRDGKDPNGPDFIFSAAAWSSFVAGLKAGM